MTTEHLDWPVILQTREEAATVRPCTKAYKEVCLLEKSKTLGTFEVMVCCPECHSFKGYLSSSIT